LLIGEDIVRARHITSSRTYRCPFGALQVGETVRLTIDVWDEPEATAELHLWVEDEDEENGGHEKLVAMERTSEDVPDGGIRFAVEYAPKVPDILWYSFNITAANGDVWRYGAREGSQVGEGAFAYGVPPSFQITVYDQKRDTLPSWYKDAIVYQIFPDRFARDDAWRERAEASIDKDHKGIPRRIVDEWNTYPRYDRLPNGDIASWDMYGGSLEGIRGKLDYLESMGITALYLNPVFLAQSNHRYDTADYMQIDPMLGTKEDFERL
jgi:4-alpha-glucanotransferase